MKNNFTKVDIKNSVEYQWRKTSFCWLLGIWAVIAVVMLFGVLIIGFDDIKPGMGLQVWLIVMSIYITLYIDIRGVLRPQNALYLEALRRV